MAGLLIGTVGAAGVHAQQPPDPPADTRPAVLRNVQIDRGGGVHLTPHFAVVFGGIKQGSGAALGPALSHEFADGSYTQVKAEYSLRQFKLLQGRFDSRPLFRQRAVVSTRLRWQDAPELALYRLGPDSTDRRAEYSERRTEWSGTIKTNVAPKTAVVFGSGIERYATSGGWIDRGEDESLNAVPQTPGLGTRPWFVHSLAAIAMDSRLSPDFTRSGRLLEATLHDYHDASDGLQSFRRFELAAEQLIPVRTDRTSAGGASGALSLSARVWLSATGEGRDVPFFLMPVLGGGNYLRGYSSYRFRDRNALLLRGEYAWAVHPSVDIAALYEAGKVSPIVRGLRLSNLAQSAGGGIRVHTRTSGLLRVDIARGSDGVKLTFGLSAGS